ncbi:hypothetical protein MP638_004070 [Amoeboaphelidium occidentale]|nr:hypothetical protein MP638_004070 [Amoeboaphelidium occidentale]
MSTTEVLSERDSPLMRSLNSDNENLPPEVEEGNVEYKLKIIPESSDRFEHLVTQMKWRLAEGNGECFYELGVADDGRLVGMTAEELEQSLKALRKMADLIQAEVILVREKTIQGEARRQRGLSRIKREIRKLEHLEANSKGAKVADPDAAFEQFKDELHMEELKVAEALVRRTGKERQLIELRIAFLGAANAGKSSLLGYLAHGELDNGKGKARLNLLRHRHELESGHSSSLSYSIVGFSSSGELIHANSDTTTSLPGAPSCDEAMIVDSASKLCMLIDTCGHEKYLKTTISSLTGYDIDYACLVVDGTSGKVDSVTKELFGCALILSVPVFIVVSKIDMAVSDESNKSMQDTVKALVELLMMPGSNRIPVVVQSTDDLVVASQNLASNPNVTPIFFVSCLTGENTDLLTQFLNLIPQRDRTNEKHKENEPVEFYIEEIYSVPETGTVVGGRLTKGTLLRHPTGWYSSYFEGNEESKLLLGPKENGKFQPVKIGSIHRQRVPVKVLRHGQSATLALDNVARNEVRKGMVIVGFPDPKAYWEFEAIIWVLYAPPSYKLPIYKEGLAVHLNVPSRKRKISENNGQTSQQGKNASVPDNISTQLDAIVHRLGTLHVGNIRQAACIVGIVEILSGSNSTSQSTPLEAKPKKKHVTQIPVETGERLKVKFRFIKCQEFVKPGMRLFFREEIDNSTKNVHGLKIVGQVI